MVRSYPEPNWKTGQLNPCQEHQIEPVCEVLPQIMKPEHPQKPWASKHQSEDSFASSSLHCRASPDSSAVAGSVELALKQQELAGRNQIFQTEHAWQQWGKTTALSTDSVASTMAQKIPSVFGHTEEHKSPGSRCKEEASDRPISLLSLSYLLQDKSGKVLPMQAFPRYSR